MRLLKDIPDLIKADIITPETADKIRDYYTSKRNSSTNQLFIVFGILGATLIGLGIILIVAHNWDELSRTTKTIFAFLPLLLGQVLCGYVLIQKQDSTAWRESITTFLFFAVGASIALVSQIYHIPGGTGPFLLTWMLLCLPLVYLMRSSAASLLYLCGITYYATHLGYGAYSFSNAYLYWFLLLGILPHYYQLYQKKPESNFMIFYSWLIPLSLVITLGTVAERTEELLFIVYFSLFGFFILVGNLNFFIEQKLINNGYSIIGWLGTIVLLFGLSFNWFWEDLKQKTFSRHEIMTAPEFYTSVIISLLAGGLLIFERKSKAFADIPLVAPVFIFFIVIFIVGLYSTGAVVLINLLVLVIGVRTIHNGAEKNHLGILNLGLLIITTLVLCRFFDTDLSFVIRGILFVLVGAGFFGANYWLLKKRKTNEY